MFFLSPWILVCQFIEISNQMKLNYKASNLENKKKLLNTLLYCLNLCWLSPSVRTTIRPNLVVLLIISGYKDSSQPYVSTKKKRSKQWFFFQWIASFLCLKTSWFCLCIHSIEIMINDVAFHNKKQTHAKLSKHLDHIYQQTILLKLHSKNSLSI